ncbi:MAG TPA: uroporphyrinogen-III synthase [Burkholderiaceae bacterium]|nr:uroporphyrinogen-III synthase [Burkholderiaceae bacterium]
MITRPAGQADALIARLQRADFAVAHVPAFEIVPLPPSPRWSAMLDRLDRFDLVHFASANAIERFFALAPHAAFAPDACLAVMGPASRAVLAQHTSHAIVVTPGQERDDDVNLDSEAMLVTLRRLRPQGFRLALFVKGEGGRNVLQGALRAAGSLTEELVLYERRCPRLSAEHAKALERVLDGAWCCTLLTSSEGATHFATMTAGSIGARLMSFPALVTHERVAQVATRLGWQHVEQCVPGDDAVMLKLESIAPSP